MLVNGSTSNASASMRRISPRANHTLRQNGAKIATPVDESVKGHCKKVEDWIESAQVALREYKKEIEMLRQEVGLMENHLSTQNDENVKVINPYVMANFEELQTSIVKQQRENDHMQKQIIELKRDKSLMQQAIMKCSHKIA